MQEIQTVFQGKDINIKTVEDGKIREKTMKGFTHLILDAGLNNLVNVNFPALLHGERLTFEYLVPERAAFYTFILEPVTSPRGNLLLRMKPDNWFISILVDDIFIEYNKVSREVITYTGIVEIRDEDCKHLQAHIEYIRE